MDVREKLVELIRKGERVHTLMPTESIANYLIEHGVTVQEWVSVTERLPDCDMFLGISRFNNKVSIYQKRGWDKDCVVGGLNIRKDIRYWMPLPEPPKEA